MKGPTSQVRFSEAQKLLDYGFNNYEFKNFASKGDIIKSINVNKGILSNVDAIIEEDSGCLIKKGETSNITTTVNLENTIPAPVEKGQKLGEITYLVGDKKIATTNIVAKNEVKSIGFGNMSTRILENWFTLFR